MMVPFSDTSYVVSLPSSYRVYDSIPRLRRFCEITWLPIFHTADFEQDIRIATNGAFHTRILRSWGNEFWQFYSRSHSPIVRGRFPKVRVSKLMAIVGASELRFLWGVCNPCHSKPKCAYITCLYQASWSMQFTSMFRTSWLDPHLTYHWISY